MTESTAVNHLQRPYKCFCHGHLQLRLANAVENISPSVDELMSFIGKFRLSDGSELNIEIAVREALANAIIHGNKLDSRKHVDITCRCSANGEVRIRIQDEGEGFRARDLSDPTTPENLLCTSGRGIHLMDALIDEVRFLACGSVVQLRMTSNLSREKTESGKASRRAS
jgi:serine/threonine-protein kinase RsbW